MRILSLKSILESVLGLEKTGNKGFSFELKRQGAALISSCKRSGSRRNIFKGFDSVLAGCFVLKIRPDIPVSEADSSLDEMDIFNSCLPDSLDDVVNICTI